MGEIPEWLRPYCKQGAYIPTKEDIENLEPQSRDEMILKYLASDLSNYYTKSEVDNLIDAIPKFDIEVVQNLPVSNISPTTVYLVPSNSESSDIYKEYIYVNNNWELIGIQKADLSNYYNKTEVDNLLDTKVDKVTGKGLSTEDYTTAEKTKLSNIEAEANKTVITQSTGSSTTSVMSQNAVNTALSNYYKKSETYTKSETNTLVNGIIGTIYPVGSIYMSVNSTSPETLFGGTWERLSNRFLVGAGATYSAGSTGGSATHSHTTGDHTLTIDEIPSHDHTVLLRTDEGIVSAMCLKYETGNSMPSSIIYDTGGGNAHNHGNTSSESNVPPYLAVYMWKRTA